MVVWCNVVALSALLLQEVLDALAAFVVQDVELWLVPEAFKFVIYFLECCDHAVVFAGFFRDHKDSIEFVHVTNKNVVFPSYDSTGNVAVP